MTLFVTIKAPYQYVYPIEDPNPKMRRIFINNMAYDLETLKPLNRQFSWQTTSTVQRVHTSGQGGTRYDNGGFPITRGKYGLCWASGNNYANNQENTDWAAIGKADCWLLSLDYSQIVSQAFYEQQQDRSFVFFPRENRAATILMTMDYWIGPDMGDLPISQRQAAGGMSNFLTFLFKTELNDEWVAIDHEPQSASVAFVRADNVGGNLFTGFNSITINRTVNSGYVFFATKTNEGGLLFLEYYPATHTYDLRDYSRNMPAPVSVLTWPNIGVNGICPLLPSNLKPYDAAYKDRAVFYIQRWTTPATAARSIIDRVVIEKNSGIVVSTTCTLSHSLFPYNHSVLFANNNSKMTIASTSIIDYSTSTNFTLEAFIQIDWYPYTNPANDENDPSQSQYFFTIVASNTFNTNNGVAFQIARNRLVYNDNGQLYMSALPHNIVVGPWYHVALVRLNNELDFYVNGKNLGSVSHNQPVPTRTETYVGARYGNAEWMRGRIASLRVTMGKAVYINEFTVPAAPLPLLQTSGTNINSLIPGDVTLLTCLDPAGRDISSYTRAITTANCVILSDTVGTISTSSVSAYNADNTNVYFRKPHVFKSGNTNYITFLMIDKGIHHNINTFGISARWDKAISRTWTTYTIGPDLADNLLSWHSEYLWEDFIDIPTSFAPLNENGDKLLITQVGRSRTLQFESTRGWTSTNVISLDARSYAIDSSNRVWLTTTGYAQRSATGDSGWSGNGWNEIHIYNPDFPDTANVSLTNPTGQSLSYNGSAFTATLALSVDNKKVFREYSANDIGAFESRPDNPFNTPGLGSVYYPLTTGTRLWITRYHEDFAFRNGDFTIDFWIRTEVAWSSLPDNGAIFGNRIQDNCMGWTILKSTRNTVHQLLFKVGYSDYWQLWSDVGPATGVWEHWAVQREGGIASWYRNGTRVASMALVGNITADPASLNAFNYSMQAGIYLNKIFLHGFRVCKGLAVYAENTYTVPTSSPEAYQAEVSVNGYLSTRAINGQCVLLTLKRSRGQGLDLSIFDDYSGFQARNILLKAEGDSIRFGSIISNSQFFTATTSVLGPINIPIVVVNSGTSAIRVLGGNYITPTTTSTILRGALVGESISYNFSKPFVTNYRLVGLIPSGVTFNTFTGVLSGTPDFEFPEQIDYPFGIVYTDQRGSSKQDYLLPVHTTETLRLEIMMVGGGGGGGYSIGAGGGAGGMLEGTATFTVAYRSYPIIIGAGGRRGTNTPVQEGANGGNTTFANTLFVAFGGGGGKSHTTTSGTNGGQNGGSGGGGAGTDSNAKTSPGGLSIQTTQSGLIGYGNPGGIGSGLAPAPTPRMPGGGGGAGGPGQNGVLVTPTKAGDGGVGRSNTWRDNTTRWYGGGGSGAPFSTTIIDMTGVNGGGGYYTQATSASTRNGQSNTGGGGAGGANNSSPYPPGNGGSGIVIVRYEGLIPKMTGGIVSQYSQNSINYTAHTFTSSGILTMMYKPGIIFSLFTIAITPGKTLVDGDALGMTFDTNEYFQPYPDNSGFYWESQSDFPGTVLFTEATGSGFVTSTNAIVGLDLNIATIPFDPDTNTVRFISTTATNIQLGQTPLLNVDTHDYHDLRIVFNENSVNGKRIADTGVLLLKKPAFTNGSELFYRSTTTFSLNLINSTGSFIVNNNSSTVEVPFRSQGNDLIEFLAIGAGGAGGTVSVSTATQLPVAMGGGGAGAISYGYYSLIKGSNITFNAVVGKGGKPSYPFNYHYLYTTSTVNYHKHYWTYLSSSTFTIDFWLNPVISTSTGKIFGLTKSGQTSGTSILINSNLQISLTHAGLNLFGGVTSTALTANTWTHIAITSIGQTGAATQNLFVNGILNSTTNVGRTFITDIGLISDPASSSGWEGGIKNLRLTRDQVLYTTNFTPPIISLDELPSTHTAWGFYDYDSLDVRSGNTPFNTDYLSTSTEARYGIYFNNQSKTQFPTGNALFNYGTGAFTVEFYFWVESLSDAKPIYSQNSSSNIGQFRIRVEADGSLTFTFGAGSGTTISTPSGSVIIKNWYKAAIVRESTDSNKTKIYLGLVQADLKDLVNYYQQGDFRIRGQGTCNYDFSNSASNAPTIGGTSYNAAATPEATREFFHGYIAYFRIIKGQALYIASTDSTNINIEYLLVGGGGGGGRNLGGGGGGGGFINTSVNTSTGIVYEISVGAGGAGSTGASNGTTGTNSLFREYSIPFNAEYLVVGGGAGGAGGVHPSGTGFHNTYPGGGGAGGYTTGTTAIFSTNNIVPTTLYNVTIGAGGSVPSDQGRGGTGGTTTFRSIQAFGGGGGGWGGAWYYPGSSGQTGAPGASGGGGAGMNGYHTGGSASPPGQGNPGGTASTTYGHGGAGGGGAGGTGGGTSGTTGGTGGIGIQNAITGTNAFWAGGGGGAGAVKGPGGSGGGGDGGQGDSNNPPVAGSIAAQPGQANRGGGGGGGISGNETPVQTIRRAGNGGSGVVALRFSNVFFMGGSGVTFTTTNVSASTRSVMITGGTGNIYFFKPNIFWAESIGGGGGGTSGGIGGGGGSGGGGSYNAVLSIAGGSQIAGQGNIGGSSYFGGTSLNAGGGGGGAGEAGNTDAAADGGDGLSSDISGTTVFYSGGGGGGRASLFGGVGGVGGGGNGEGSGGGGGQGSSLSGGGGGGGTTNANGFSGGSGIVILKYPDTYTMLNQSSLNLTTINTSGYNITTFLSGAGLIRFDQRFTTSSITTSNIALFVANTPAIIDTSNYNHTVTTVGSPQARSTNVLALNRTYPLRREQSIAGVWTPGINTDYIDLNLSGTVFPATTNPMTLEFWFNWEGRSNANYPNQSDILHWGTLGAANGLQGAVRLTPINDYDAYLSCFGQNATGTVGIPTATISGEIVVHAFRWYHVMITRSGATVKMYLNGTEVGTQTNTNSWGSSHYFFTGTLYLSLTPDNIQNRGWYKGHFAACRIVQNQALVTGGFNVSTGKITPTVLGHTGTNVVAAITGTVIMPRLGWSVPYGSVIKEQSGTGNKGGTSSLLSTNGLVGISSQGGGGGGGGIPPYFSLAEDNIDGSGGGQSPKFVNTVTGFGSIVLASTFNPAIRRYANGGYRFYTNQNSTASWSVSFNGTSDFIHVPYIAGLAPGTNDFTIEFYIYPRSWTTLAGIFTTGYTGNLGYSILCGADQTIKFFASSTGATWNLIDGVSISKGIPLNKWTHIVIQRFGGVLTCYQNKFKITDTALTGNINNPSSANFHIGRYHTYFFNGLISNLRYVSGRVYTDFLTPPGVQYIDSVEYLVVGGGAGGAGGVHPSGTGFHNTYPGGGGAGGVLMGTYTNNIILSPDLLNLNPYSLSIGAGGSVPSDQGRGGTGGTTTFRDIQAFGGGGGGWGGAWYYPGSSGETGAPGASGGGGAGMNGYHTGGSASPPGQGNPGGTASTTYGHGGAGGGGAGGTGGGTSGTTGGTGGAGRLWLDNLLYGGGGGGAGAVKGPGGTGGGGDGGQGDSNNPPVAGSTAAQPGQANRGGGGGGGISGNETPVQTIRRAGTGGSGLVALRYSNTLTAIVSAGLTVSTINTTSNKKISYFTQGAGNVSFTPSVVGDGDPYEYLNYTRSPLTAITGTQLLTCQSERIIDNSPNGLNLRTFELIKPVAYSPFDGPVQNSISTGQGGGGGGAMPVPLNAVLESAFGGTGTNVFSDWVNVTGLGEYGYFGGGGGAGILTDIVNTTTTAGLGGGGSGGTILSKIGSSGTQFTGGGGGGAVATTAYDIVPGGEGGDGVVILRYRHPYINAVSGAQRIITTGSYTYHVFTSSAVIILSRPDSSDIGSFGISVYKDSLNGRLLGSNVNIPIYNPSGVVAISTATYGSNQSLLFNITTNYINTTSIYYNISGDITETDVVSGQLYGNVIMNGNFQSAVSGFALTTTNLISIFNRTPDKIPAITFELRQDSTTGNILNQISLSRTMPYAYQTPWTYEIITLTASGTITLTGNGTTSVTITKTSGSNAWDAHAYTTQGFTAPCTIEFNKTASSTDDTASYAMIGWNADPTTDANYTTLDYAAYLIRTDRWEIYHNNVSTIVSRSWDPNQKHYIVYDQDGYIKHYNGNTLMYNVYKGLNQTVYLDTSMYNVNAVNANFKNVRIVKRAWNGITYAPLQV